MPEDLSYLLDLKPEPPAPKGGEDLSYLLGLKPDAPAKAPEPSEMPSIAGLPRFATNEGGSRLQAPVGGLQRAIDQNKAEHKAQVDRLVAQGMPQDQAETYEVGSARGMSPEAWQETVAQDEERRKSPSLRAFEGVAHGVATPIVNLTNVPSGFVRLAGRALSGKKPASFEFDNFDTPEPEYQDFLVELGDDGKPHDVDPATAKKNYESALSDYQKIQKQPKVVAQKPQETNQDKAGRFLTELGDAIRPTSAKKTLQKTAPQTDVGQASDFLGNVFALIPTLGNLGGAGFATQSSGNTMNEALDKGAGAGATLAAGAGQAAKDLIFFKAFSLIPTLKTATPGVGEAIDSMARNVGMGMGLTYAGNAVDKFTWDPKRGILDGTPDALSVGLAFGLLGLLGRRAPGSEGTPLGDSAFSKTDYSKDTSAARASDHATANFVSDYIKSAPDWKTAEIQRQKMRDKFSGMKDGDYFAGQFDQFFPRITSKNWDSWKPNVPGMEAPSNTPEPQAEPAKGNSPLATPTMEPPRAEPPVPAVPAPPAGPEGPSAEGGAPLAVPGEAAGAQAPSPGPAGSGPAPGPGGAGSGRLSSPEVAALAEQVQQLETVAAQTAAVAQQHPHVEQAQSDAEEAADLLQAAKDRLGYIAPEHPVLAPPAPAQAPQQPTPQQVAALQPSGHATTPEDLPSNPVQSAPIPVQSSGVNPLPADTLTHGEAAQTLPGTPAANGGAVPEDQPLAGGPGLPGAGAGGEAGLHGGPGTGREPAHVDSPATQGLPDPAEYAGWRNADPRLRARTAGEFPDLKIPGALAPKATPKMLETISQNYAGAEAVFSDLVNDGPADFTTQDGAQVWIQPNTAGGLILQLRKTAPGAKSPTHSMDVVVAGNAAYVRAIQIDPAHRGQGASTRLYQDAARMIQAAAPSTKYLAADIAGKEAIRGLTASYYGTVFSEDGKFSVTPLADVAAGRRVSRAAAPPQEAPSRPVAAPPPPPEVPSSPLTFKVDGEEHTIPEGRTALVQRLQTAQSAYDKAQAAISAKTGMNVKVRAIQHKKVGDDFADVKRRIRDAMIEETPKKSEVPKELHGIPGLRPSGGVYQMPTAQIHADPARFQYKKQNETTGIEQISAKTGASGSLQGVKVWNPESAGVLDVWRDPQDGKVYVVNGHNRFDKALELGVPQVKVRFIEAKDAKEALTFGARKNLAEGNGTALDAATYFRNTGMGEADLAKAGLPTGKAVVQDGMALASLPDTWFHAAAVSPDLMRLAVETGKAGLDKGQADTAFRELHQILGKKEPSDVTSAFWKDMLDRIKGSQAVHSGQVNLFGEEEYQSTLEQQTDLIRFIRSKLKADMQAGTVLTGKRYQEAVGQMATVDSQKAHNVKAEASTSLGHFEQQKHLAPIGDVINEYAAKLAQAGSAKDAESIRLKALDAVRESIRRDLEGAPAGNRSGRGGVDQSRGSGESQDSLFQEEETSGRLPLEVGARAGERGAVAVDILTAPAKLLHALAGTEKGAKALETIQHLLKGIEATFSPNTVSPETRLTANIKANEQSRMNLDVIRLKHAEKEAHRVAQVLDPNTVIKVMDIIEGKNQEPLDPQALRGLLADALGNRFKGARLDGMVESTANEVTRRRQLNEALHVAEAKLGAFGGQSESGYVENYWQRNWKQKGKPAKTSGSPKLFEGTKSWTKKRIFPYFSDAVEAGIDPVSWNIFDQFDHGYIDALKYLCDHTIVKITQENGLLKYKRGGGPPTKAPDDRAWLDPQIGQVLTRSALVKNEETGKMEWKPSPGLHVQGWWHADPYVANILNHMVTKGLASYHGPTTMGVIGSLYRTLRSVQNAMTQSLLSVSGFHGVTVSMDAVAQNFSDAMQSWMNAEFKDGMVSFAKAATVLPTVIENVFEGTKLRKQMREGTADPGFEKWYVAGGGRLELDSESRIGAAEHFSDSLHRMLGRQGWIPYERQEDGSFAPISGSKDFWQRSWAAAKLPVLAPFAAIDYAARPLMKHFVPIMKLAAAKILYAAELKRLSEDAKDAVKALSSRKVIQQIENRMGQLTKDNLNWHPLLNDFLNATFLATTWNYGSVALFGGAQADLGRAIRDLHLSVSANFADPETAEAIRKKIKEDREQRGETGKNAWFTRNMSQVLATKLVYIFVTGILTYLLTGSFRRDPKHIDKIRTGQKTPEGKDEYLDIAGYNSVYRDLWRAEMALTGIQHKGNDLTSGWSLGVPSPGHTGQIIKGKLSPALKLGSDLWTNTDWTGNRQVFDPDAPFGTKAKQMDEHALKGAIPISVKQATEKWDSQGVKSLRTVVGTNIPPKRETDSDAEARLRQMLLDRQPRVVEKAKGDREAMIRNAKDAYVVGNPKPLEELKAQGLLTAKDQKNILRNFKDQSLIVRLSNATNIEAGDLIKVWDDMTPEEKVATFPAITRKMGTAFKSTPPAQRDALKENWKQITQEVKSIKAEPRSSQ